MSRFETTIPATYFDDLYAADPDPWRFSASAYESDKYAATLGALPDARYNSALEVGCSIGVLTRALAARCDALLAVDVANAALEQAKLRCKDMPHVRFGVMRVPIEWPIGRFDLTVLSEVIYYLDDADVRLLAERVLAATKPGGDIVLVHWLGETNYPLSGDEAAESFMASMGGSVRVLSQSRTSEYRLDVLRVISQSTREANGP